MKPRVHNTISLIYPAGSQVVTLQAVQKSPDRTLHPAGAVGVIVRSPADRQHPYCVRFVDNVEAALLHDDLQLLAEYKQDVTQVAGRPNTMGDFDSRIIYRCVVGSRAFGLATQGSDTDRRGIFLPTAELLWSLDGVPEQLVNKQTEECYWELQKFLTLALKGNPNILECLYTPLVEHATPLAQELLAMRASFLSRVLYQTYNGYVMSQFKRIQVDLRNQGQAKPKHMMHLIRVLISGIHALREGAISVDVGPHREQLLAIRNGDMPWQEVDIWRSQLHAEFTAALQSSCLPERPDYKRANAFLIKARRLSIAGELP